MVMRLVLTSPSQFGGYLLGSFAVELPLSKMGSRFFGSVLLLTLITLVLPAAGSGYRYGGRTLHSEQSEGLPRSYEPAASSYTQPRASLGSSRLAESAYRPRATAGGQGSSYGRHVDGHSHQGSVSSYRPVSPWSSQPGQTPQQTHQGANKGKSAVWASPSLQNVNGFGPRVVSSGAIEMVSESKPQQQPEFPAPSRPQVKAGAWGDSLGAKQANAAPRSATSTSYTSWQKPSSGSAGVVKGKWDTGSGSTGSQTWSQAGSGSTGSQTWSQAGSGSTSQFPHSNKQTGAHPRGPRPMGSSYFSRVERPSSEMPGLQTKEDTRKTAFPRSRSQVKSVSTADHAPGVYSKARPLPRQLTSSTSRVFQNNWDAALSSNVQSPRSNKEVGARSRGTRPMTSTSFSRIESPSSETAGVLQTKKGMWETHFPQSGNDLSVSGSRRVPALYSTQKPPEMESGSPVSSKTDIKAISWTGLQSNPLMPRSKPVPLASRYPYEGKRPKGVSISGRRQSSAY